MAEATEVGSLYYDLDAPTEKLDKSLGKADKKVQDFGDSTAKASDGIKDGLNKAALGFTVVGAGLTLAAKNATDFTVGQVSNAKMLSRQIGTSIEEASRLTAAFGRMGLSPEQASVSFGVFSKNIVEATKNVGGNKLALDKLNIQIEATKKEIVDTSKEIKNHGDKSGDLNLKLKALNNTLATQEASLKQSSDGFAKLGVKTTDASGKQKDFQTILFEVADKFKEMPNGIDKTAASMDLFGRSGKELLPVLNLGSDGIKQLEKDADRLGLTLSADTIGKVNELIQSQKELKQQTDSVKIAIGTATAPVLTEFNGALADILGNLLATDSPMRGLTANVLAFGGPALTFIGSALGMGANLVTIMQGANSASGAIVGLQAVSASGLILPVGAAVASIGILIFTLKEAADVLDRIKGSIKDLSQKRVQVGNTKIQASGTSSTGLIQQLRSAFSGFASGTDFAPGGLSWVGEHGRELLNVPRGSQIVPHNTSESIAKTVSNGAQQTAGITINIGTISNRSDADYLLAKIDRNQQRLRMGVSPA